MPIGDVMSYPLYAWRPCESLNTKFQFRSEFWGIGGKSKIEDQRLVETLMMYNHAENLLILSRDEKEETFVSVSADRQTDRRTGRVED